MNLNSMKRKISVKYKIVNTKTNEICKNSLGVENYALSEGWAEILLARYKIEMPNQPFKIIKVKEHV